MMNANGVCLPNDLLLDVLRRIPGRALAVSRGIFRVWRDLIGPTPTPSSSRRSLRASSP